MDPIITKTRLLNRKKQKENLESLTRDQLLDLIKKLLSGKIKVVLNNPDAALGDLHSDAQKLELVDVLNTAAMQLRGQTIDFLRENYIDLNPPNMRQIEAIYNFVKEGVDYVRDPSGIECLSDGKTMWRVRAGDCDDKVIMAGGMLKSIGYDISVVFVDLSGEGEDHVCLAVSAIDMPDINMDKRITLLSWPPGPGQVVPLIWFDTTYFTHDSLGKLPPHKHKRIITLF